MLAQIRQILEHNLVLQGYGRGGNNQRFAQGFGHGYCGNQIGQCFTGTSAGFDHTSRRWRGALAIVLGDIAHVTGNLGDHQPLAIARPHVLSCKNVPVTLLNLLFDLVG